MARPDVFAFGRSGLNAFLFATVGTEVNGSSLTVLSTLARQGADPWLLADRWACMSRAAAGAALAEAIGGMPLRACDLAAASATADRLIGLLFVPATPAAPVLAGLGLKTGPTMTVYLAIGLAIILSLVFVLAARTVPDDPAPAPAVTAPR